VGVVIHYSMSLTPGLWYSQQAHLNLDYYIVTFDARLLHIKCLYFSLGSISFLPILVEVGATGSDELGFLLYNYTSVFYEDQLASSTNRALLKT
jgi:hypothetical protein